MQKCITCGAELHPERAKKYNYCMSPECQEKNAKGLTMVAVGVNKSAEQYFILDEQTKSELASGKYHDQRRGSFGTSPASPGASTAARPGTAPGRGTAARTGTAVSQPRRKPAKPAQPATRTAARKPWTGSQERLALLYNEQGLQPGEIAQKLGLSTYLVTQIILSSRNRGKL
jgi:hypothetical protein